MTSPDASSPHQPTTGNDPVRTLRWSHGEAQVQRLGAMLAPVVFRAAGQADFAPLQVAPWADEPGSAALPGILQRLRGEWPCVPFGRTDRPADLPAGWSQREPGDDWGHGYASHHHWQWLPADDDPFALALSIHYPLGQPVQRLTRRIRALPEEPTIELSLQIEVREACTLPVALHPTFRLDAGRVQLHVEHSGPGITYPVPAETGISRLRPDATFTQLQAVPLADGGTLDLSRFPLPFDTEELLQLQDVAAPLSLHFIDQRWTLQLDWDRDVLPDVMLWVSHRGRSAPPWNGRHWALGGEPVNGAFDLGRVAAPPSVHPAARRHGVALRPGEPLIVACTLRALPHG